MLERVVAKFFPSKKISGICPFGKGHINDTYKVSFIDEVDSYVLQRINNRVFKNPQIIAANHLKLQSVFPGEQGVISIPCLCQTTDGEYLFIDNQNFAWRMTNFFKDARSLDVVTQNWQASQAGIAFGWFAKTCSRLNANDFEESIPDFHNLSSRVKQLDEAVRNNNAGRLDSAAPWVNFYHSRLDQLMIVEELYAKGEIPRRVIHNDTKINNLLFSGKMAVAVIDLDTVGPGMIFYDYGDTLRTITNTAAEDEQDLSKVGFNMARFKTFTRAYLQQTSSMLLHVERDLFHLSPFLMTFIIGIRFLADYLNGDTYFKTAYPQHNLVRSLTQKQLLLCMESRKSDIQKFISKQFI